MTDKMADTPNYHGSLVAFEGPQDTISTQLRLLPNSSNILVLPPIHCFLKEENASSSFDARLCILKVHEACNVRAEMALTFLRESTPDNKRLVFMNGGTVTAQMSCITSISEHATNGDVMEAELIFNELIQNGIAGLERRNMPIKNNRVISSAEKVAGRNRHDETLEDPVSRAMRAADALDLETASLQSTDELDLTITARPRSLSVPARPFTENLHNVASFSIFGSPRHQEAATLRGTGESQYSHAEEWRSTITTEGQLIGTNAAPKSPSCVGEVYPSHPLPPMSAVCPPYAELESLPNSPAVLGEALLVDLRPSMPSAIHKRVKSVDRIHANAIRNQNISLSDFPPPVRAKLGEAQHKQNNAEEREVDSTNTAILRSKFYSETPHPMFVKSNKNTLRKGPPSPLDLGTKKPKRAASYIDQSTSPLRNCINWDTITEPGSNVQEADAENGGSFLDLGEDFELDANEPFQTVLPIVEDLVIHFKGNERNIRLEAMIQAFKDGIYPVSMPPLLPEPKNYAEQPSTPITRASTPKPAGEDIPDSCQVNKESTSICQHNPDEYDPFASHGDYLQPPNTYLPKQNTSGQPQTVIIVPAPPTPAHTPPPPTTNATPDTLFHDFNTTEYNTAVCTQNSLRSILNIYFSPDDTGYHQFNFPLLPELGTLWRPVFQEAPSGDPKKAKRKIDLILGIGAQKGVDREFLGFVSSCLEKLGTKPTRTTRSGRLDVRYLIANAMQAFTAQPLANQAQDNPFSDPLLLATLILPHLETYMAAHSATRFLLLEYPAEHLSTILALQRLVGVDLLKVAGIIDAEANEPKSYGGVKQLTSPASVHSARSSISDTSIVSQQASPTLLTPNGPKSGPTEWTTAPPASFSRANFILTSTATESEIETLISTIRKALINISTFYIPESVMVPKSALTTEAGYISAVASVGETTGNSTRRDHSSRDRPLAQTPLLDNEQQYAPLASAAVISCFASSPAEQQQHRPPSNYVSSGTDADLPAPPTQPLATPLKSSKASITETIRSSRTAKTARSQRSKLKNILGSETAAATPVGDAASYLDISDGDEDMQFANEERKYMPLWSQQGRPCKGNSRKALKWLGLAT
ncbi:hypothetical protein F5Y19DRAFT_470282 [Xylariaceae sp. FL1651]|nr:hypothetical protein F5Y19DRAFT_470282 [Xylariaceae sp. FL1651]